eukprot:3672951-Karenia_brevis.AAC.1
MFLHGACGGCLGDFGYNASRGAAGVIGQRMGTIGAMDPKRGNSGYGTEVGSELMGKGRATNM